MGKKGKGKNKGGHAATDAAAPSGHDHGHGHAAGVAGPPPSPAPVGPPPDPVDATRVATRLSTAAVHLLRRLHKEDAARGVSSTRLSALTVLVLGGPRTLGQLADAEGVTDPSMTRLVTAMEAEGLVARSRSKDDGRLVIISATEQGAELLHRGRDQRVAVLADLVRTLPEDDQRCLADASAILEDLVRPARRS
ncbi:MAG: MarR family transcriptional regulator [Chloroflexota bacterium]